VFMGSILISIVGPIVTGLVTFFILYLLRGVMPDKPKGVRRWAEKHIWPHGKWVVTSAVLLSAMFVFLGLWLTSPVPGRLEVPELKAEIILPTPVEVETTEPTSPTVKITELELASSSPVISVAGICRGIPQESSLWVVSFSYASHKFYVQQRAGSMPKVESEPWTRWQSLAAVGAGQNDNTECRFEVWAVIVGQEAERRFLDHIAEGKREEGMERLPEEAYRAYDRIEVRLKSKEIRLKSK